MQKMHWVRRICGAGWLGAFSHCQTRKVGGRFYLWFPTALAKDLTWEVLILINLARLSISINWKAY